MRRYGHLFLALAVLSCGDSGTAPKSQATSISINPSSATVMVGETTTFSATVRDQFGEVMALPVTWRVGTATVASCNSSGVATGLSAGETLIFAEYGSISANAQLLVRGATSIAISPTSVAVSLGETASFSAQVLDQLGQPMNLQVTWSIADQSVATIDANGTVTGVSPGETTALATYGSVEQTAQVQVVDNSPPTVSLLSPQDGESVADTITVRVEATDDHDVAWAALVINGAAVDTVFSSPANQVGFSEQRTGTRSFEIRWDTRSVGNRTHELRTVVGDPTGNTATSGAISVSVENPIGVRVTNQLMRRIWVEIGYDSSSWVGSLTGWVAANSWYEFSVVVPEGDVLQMSWEAEKPTTTSGTPLGERIAGMFGDRTPDELVERYTVDNVVGEATYYYPLLTNNTAATLLPSVDIGFPNENRCPCSLPPGWADAAIGFYRFHSQSRVGVYNAATGYTGPSLYFHDFGPWIVDGSGALSLTFSAEPVSGMVGSRLQAPPAEAGDASDDDQDVFLERRLLLSAEKREGMLPPWR